MNKRMLETDEPKEGPLQSKCGGKNTIRLALCVLQHSQSHGRIEHLVKLEYTQRLLYPVEPTSQ